MKLFIMLAAGLVTVFALNDCDRAHTVCYARYQNTFTNLADDEICGQGQIWLDCLAEGCGAPSEWNIVTELKENLATHPPHVQCDDLLPVSAPWTNSCERTREICLTVYNNTFDDLAENQICGQAQAFINCVAKACGPSTEEALTKQQDTIATTYHVQCVLESEEDTCGLRWSACTETYNNDSFHALPQDAICGHGQGFLDCWREACPEYIEKTSYVENTKSELTAEFGVTCADLHA